MHNMVKIRLHVTRVRRLLYVSDTSLISVVTHIIRSFRHQFAVACIGLVEGSLVLAQSHVHETVSVRIELVVGLVVGQQGFSEHHVSDSVRWTCCWSTRPSEHHVSDSVRLHLLLGDCLLCYFYGKQSMIQFVGLVVGHVVGTQFGWICRWRRTACSRPTCS